MNEVSSKIDFKGLKYGAETFSEMTNGLVTPDGAAAILAYSPDLKTSIGREIGIGSIMYGITLGGGLTIGAIKNRNFRNFVKETYQSNTFAGGLKKANQQGYTDFDIFDQYWNANNIGFLKNFRKEDQIVANEVIVKISDAIESIIQNGLSKTMNQYNA